MQSLFPSFFSDVKKDKGRKGEIAGMVCNRSAAHGAVLCYGFSVLEPIARVRRPPGPGVLSSNFKKKRK